MGILIWIMQRGNTRKKGGTCEQDIKENNQSHCSGHTHMKCFTQEEMEVEEFNKGGQLTSDETKWSETVKSLKD